MTVTINGTSGITSPGLNSTGSNTLGDNVADTLNVGNGTIVTDSSGNVGIGTSSPNNYSNQTSLTVNGTNNSRLDMKVGGTDTAGMVVSSTAAYVQARTAIPLVFNTNGSERMRIDSSGNLLVGTTSLSGYGGLFVRPNYDGDTAGVIWNKTNATSTIAAEFRYNGGQKGYIAYTSSGTTYNTTSDYRLKENIQPMKNALDVVAQLKPVTYDWKADGSAGQGFIAHELQEVVPDCVTGEKDAVDADGKPVYQGIDTSFLVATLTKAIQELSAKVDAQQLEIEALKGAAA